MRFFICIQWRGFFGGGLCGQKEREAFSIKECRSVHESPDQRQFVLSLNSSIYLCMYLFTSQALWEKSYG